jgi:hypothetical protein
LASGHFHRRAILGRSVRAGVSGLCKSYRPFHTPTLSTSRACMAHRLRRLREKPRRRLNPIFAIECLLGSETLDFSS